MDASVAPAISSDHRHVVPRDERPQMGDTFKVRRQIAEIPDLNHLVDMLEMTGVLDLDVYNPADPPVCYVVGDSDRWRIEVEDYHKTAGIGTRIIIRGRWTNQQFPGPSRVEIRVNPFTFDLDVDECELEFIG